ncbi:hypothetical protein ACFLYK_03830 [Candidatus Cloacimonadota bacterium]
MELNLDLITVINTILCIIIFILGVTSLGKSKNIILLIAWAFGIFAISHIFKILNLSQKFEVFLIVIRFAAYLLIIVGVAKLRKK